MNALMDILKVIVLGIVQGITEWLPISSTGHMILINDLWPLLPEEFFSVFLVVIQFGSILAVLLLYFNKLNPFNPRMSASRQKHVWNLWIKIIIGCIPAGIAGLLLDDFIDLYFSTPYVIATSLIIYGIVFIVISARKRRPVITKIHQLSYKNALAIGFFQCLALIPGTSRSGATILGGLDQGCSRPVASEFSFFIAIPIMAAASLLRLLKYFLNIGGFTLFQTFLLLLGTVISFVVSLFALRAMLSYVRKHSFAIFGWYRIALGILVLIVFYLF